VQITTVRYKGLFLDDPLGVPWPVVDYLAEQLGIGDPSEAKRYGERPKTAYEHTWMIRDAYGYHVFDDREGWEGRQLSKRFLAFLHGRAWTHAEGPTALFEQSVAWLRRHRVLLPGVTVLERLVGSVRERADDRMYAVVARQAERAGAGLPRALAELLEVPEGARVSELERLRQAPKRQSGTEMVRALRRVDDLARFELGRVRVGKVPVRRMKTLARYGAGSKAPALARLHEPRKTATLLAVTRSLEAEAIDDALDLFTLLMATRLISPARRKSAGERLAMLPKEIDASLVTAAWRRPVYANPEVPAGAVDHDAYVVCALEALFRALQVRDVFAAPSNRWADPRASAGRAPVGGDQRGRAGVPVAHRPGRIPPGRPGFGVGRGLAADGHPSGRGR
jgi:hypothetical protein